MICLADNDIILKLAQCHLLAEAVEALDATYGEVYVLNTAKFKLINPAKPARGRVKPDEPAHARLQAFFAAVREIEVTPSADEQRAFDDLQGVDAGEAVLFSASAHYPGSLLTTSDKRSLTALVAAPDPVCVTVCGRLAGRVVCFEQVVLRLIDQFGFDLVHARVAPARDCDTALRIVFGSGLTAAEQGVRDGLGSYINDLRGRTGGLLAP